MRECKLSFLYEHSEHKVRVVRNLPKQSIAAVSRPLLRIDKKILKGYNEKVFYRYL